MSCKRLSKIETYLSSYSYKDINKQLFNTLVIIRLFGPFSKIVAIFIILFDKTTFSFNNCFNARSNRLNINMLELNDFYIRHIRHYSD